MRTPILQLALLLLVVTSVRPAVAQVEFQLAGEGGVATINRVVFGDLPAVGLAGLDVPPSILDTNCESKGKPGTGPADIAPGADELAQPADFGDPMGSYSAAPGVIGDFFGGGLRYTIGSNTFSAPVAAGDRIFKIVENMSPIPTDRVFFNYHLFNDPLISADGRGVDLHRYVFGCERTIAGGRISFEIRVPFASGLNSAQDTLPASINFNDGTEFGNLAFAVKMLLVNRANFSLSGGLGVSTPTADDSEVLTGGNRVALVENEAFHLQPYVALLFRPSQRSWLQLVSQASFSANGNSVFIDATGMTGVIQDQALLFMTASHGRWIYRNDQDNTILRGIAPMVELHYSTTMQDSDRFNDPIAGKSIENPANRMDLLHVTGGIRLQLGQRTFVTASAVAPLRDGTDRVFDSEFSLQVVRTR